MQKLIFFSFVVLARPALFGQLNGEYHHRNEWTSENFIFKKNHRVDYTFYGEESIKKGRGKYKLKGDSLVLYFDKHPLDTLAMNLQVIQKAGENIFCLVTVKVINRKDSAAAVSATVLLASKSSSTKEGYANGEGIAELKVPISNDSMHLFIRYLDFSTLNFSFVPTGRYFITAYMGKEGTQYYKKGDKQVFYIVSRTVKDMKLTRNRGSQGTLYWKLIP